MSDEPIDWSRTTMDCGDAGCVFRDRLKPGGMRTNGGCQHLKLTRAEFVRLVQVMAQEIRWRRMGEPEAKS